MDSSVECTAHVQRWNASEILFRASFAGVVEYMCVPNKRVPQRPKLSGYTRVHDPLIAKGRANPRVTGRLVSAGMVFIGVSKFLFKRTGLFVFSTFSTLLTHEIALRYKSPVEFGANKAGHTRNQSITWSKTGRLLNQREIPPES